MTSSRVFNNLVLRMCIVNNPQKCYFRQMCHLHLQGVTNKIYTNPCLDLQQYLEIPLTRKEDIGFDPSLESMKAACQLFLPHKNNIIRRISDTIDPKKFPSHDLPEVAILGRSNAGKTSLLKAIFNTMPELRIQASRNPGHTKSLKFYQVGTSVVLVDMPGYGYRQPPWFKTSVIPYLKDRKNLVKTFLLIDVKESFHDWDDAILQMLGDIKIPFAVILTKIDAVSDSVRLKNLLHVKNIVKDNHFCFPQIFMLSSHTLEGLAFYLTFIAYISGNLNTKIS